MRTNDFEPARAGSSRLPRNGGFYSVVSLPQQMSDSLSRITEPPASLDKALPKRHK